MTDKQVGDSTRLFVDFRNPDDEPTDPTTVVLTITKPDATTLTPVPAHPSMGRYEYDVGLDQAGGWAYRWQGTGAVAAVEEGTFVVRTTPGLDAGVGTPTANSYLTVAEADAIADQQALGRVGPRWLDATIADRERALIRATTEIDAYVGYAGTRYATDQALLFPRTYDYVDGLPVINANVRLATFWQAAHVLANANQIDDANTRRARGLISFSDDDGSGSVASVRPEWGMISAQALGYLNAVRSAGRATLRSVPIASTYSR